MYTQCPECSTLFEIDAALLAPAHGRLCCGACGGEFDALARLAEAPAAAAVGRSAAGAPPRVEPAQNPAQTELFALPKPAPAMSDAGVPSFARGPLARVDRSSVRWIGLAMLLTASLALQIVFAQRAELATDAQWRAWLAPLCARLGCSLPPWHDRSELTLAARSISPHPSSPGGLLVSATLQNDAPWGQSWPLLELTLSDLDGNPMATRRFTADEYLGGPPSQSTLAAGQSAMAQLELADPGKEAVAFAFDFH